MVLPLLLGGAAVAAGAKGIQDYVQGQEQEKEAKKQAMRSLYNNMMHDPKHAIQAPIPKAPGVFETVIAPMGQAAVGGALSAGLSGLGAPKDPPGSEAAVNTAASEALAKAKPTAMPAPDRGLPEQIPGMRGEDNPYYRDYSSIA